MRHSTNSVQNHNKYFGSLDMFDLVLQSVQFVHTRAFEWVCGAPVPAGLFAGLDPAPLALPQLSGGSDVMHNGGPQG